METAFTAQQIVQIKKIAKDQALEVAEDMMAQLKTTHGHVVPEEMEKEVATEESAKPKEDSQPAEETVDEVKEESEPSHETLGTLGNTDEEEAEITE